MCLLTIGTAKQEEEEEKDAFAAAGIRRGQNPKVWVEGSSFKKKEKKKNRAGGPREQEYSTEEFPLWCSGNESRNY